MDMGGGRLIRFMILVFMVILIWKVWDYSALPVIEIPNFKTIESDTTKLAPVPKSQQIQNHEPMNILPAPDKPEEMKTHKFKIIGPNDVVPDENKPSLNATKKPIGTKQTNLLTQEMEVYPPMRVAVYYEALCPDSRHFVMKQLTPAYQKLKDIIEISLVPYGKANTHESGGRYIFDCQHGPLECQANMVHACVTNTVKDQTKQLSIVHCMIDRNVPPQVIGQKCVEKYKENWKSVEKCINSDKGQSIMKHLGDMTNSLSPRAFFIPTITIDGSQDDQKHILQDLYKVLCRKYKGPKPPSC